MPIFRRRELSGLQAEHDVVWALRKAYEEHPLTVTGELSTQILRYAV